MVDVLGEAVVRIGGQLAGDFAVELIDEFNEIEVSAEQTAAALDKIQQAADAAGSVAAAGFNAVSNASQKASDVVGQVGGSITGFTDGLATFGIISDTTADNVANGLGIIEDGLAAASGASELAGQAVVAYTSTLSRLPVVQKAVTVAQRALNLVLLANPTGLVIAAIALLVAGLVLAYKKSETFRNVVNAAFNKVKAVAQSVFGFVSQFIAQQVDKWQKRFTTIKEFLGTVWDGLKSGIKTAVDFALGPLRVLRKAINFVISGLNKAFPGGKEISLIPSFASGVRNFRGGLAVVGERGPEVVDLPAGSDVYSNTDSRRMLAGGGVTINQNFFGPQTGSDRKREIDWAIRSSGYFGPATSGVA